MTYEELKKKFAMHKPRSDEEHRLQAACVHWFRYAYPKLMPNLFAVPNGGRRDEITGKRLKDEGVLAGVADLILLYPSREYNALLIEMKVKGGKLKPVQKEWGNHLYKSGYKYVVCYSKEAFINEIMTYLHNVNYLHLDPTPYIKVRDSIAKKVKKIITTKPK